jgi:hypothetical protein
MVSQMGVQSVRSLTAVEKVRRLESECTEAVIGRDTVALNNLLSDHFLVVTPVGKLNKAQCLEEIQTGNLTFESICWEEAVVRDYGSELVVSGVVSVIGQYKGQDISGQYGYRCSQAHLKGPGRWQVLAGQATHITVCCVDDGSQTGGAGADGRRQMHY